MPRGAAPGERPVLLARILRGPSAVAMTKSWAMLDVREAGILLHPTSLPGGFGTGDIGPEACAFADRLSEARQRWWQMLPVVPPGAGNSPYSSASAFAGSELLVSPEWMSEDGLLAAADVAAAKRGPRPRASYETARTVRMRLLAMAFETFQSRGAEPLESAFESFVAANASWLPDWALFRALKDANGGVSWAEWERPLRDREKRALAKAREQHARAIRFHGFVQFLFERYWTRFREYARWRGVGMIGDVPIFVEHDSADVWAHRELFLLDASGRRRAQAGVPPDYFSSTGQLWGNPLYRWSAHEDTRYRWWTARLRQALSRFDLLRLDHFIGFHRAWALPPRATTAAEGRWQRGPGDALFVAVARKLGALPLIAEDLGLVIPEVKQLRDRLGLPGMKVLQFAFGDDAEADAYKPHNHVPHSFVYTGTHDNDTVVGWFSDRGGSSSTRTPEQIARECAFALRYLASDGREIHWDMIRAAYSSVARTAIVPLQDVLGLGSAHRMNVPGTATGNWEWRFETLPERAFDRLAVLTETFGRAPAQLHRAVRDPAPVDLRLPSPESAAEAEP